METTTTSQQQQTKAPRLERPTEGRLIAGVAAGIAERTGVSVFLVRLGFVIATFFAGFGALVYLAGWVLLPNQGMEKSPAESWREDLTTRGRRAGAFFIGIAGLLLISITAPVAALAAVAILLAAAILAPGASLPGPATPTPAAGELEADEDRSEM